MSFQESFSSKRTSSVQYTIQLTTNKWYTSIRFALFTSFHIRHSLTSKCSRDYIKNRCSIFLWQNVSDCYMIRCVVYKFLHSTDGIRATCCGCTNFHQRGIHWSRSYWSLLCQCRYPSWRDHLTRLNSILVLFAIRPTSSFGGWTTNDEKRGALMSERIS